MIGKKFWLTLLFDHRWDHFELKWLLKKDKWKEEKRKIKIKYKIIDKL